MTKGRKNQPLHFETLEARCLLSADPILPVLEHGDTAGHHHEDGHHHHDEDIRIDVFGNAYYVDPIPPVDPILETEGVAGASGTAAAPTVGDVFKLHSNPNATRKIYLDFDGHSVAGTYWNYYHGGRTIHAPAYSQDSDIFSFSTSELATIEEIWRRVAEDYAPFNVDVTTEDPGPFALTEGGRAIRVLITSNVDEAALGGTGGVWWAGAGGVAYLNSWTWAGDTPAFVFENNLANGNEKYTAEAISHEVGHTLGLSHDGSTSSAYYTGHGSGDTGWSTIMGLGYYKELTQWSRGEYAGANQTQDDIGILASRLGLRADDHGDYIAAATTLSPDANGNVHEEGLISTRSDRDGFSFTTGTGTVTLNIDPFDYADGKSNLDILAEIYDSSRRLVARSNPSDRLDASFSLHLSAGTYHLFVYGTGMGSPSGTGYSDYGSLGRYEVSGRVATVPTNQAPTARNDFATTQAGQSVTIHVLNNDTDSDGDALSLTSVGSPRNGSAVRSGDAIVYTPKTGLAGTDTFTYSISDGNGGTDTATVTVTVEEVAPQFRTLGESGTVTVRQRYATQWHKVTLQNSYDDAVVIMGPISYNDGSSSTVRVRNVGTNSFEFQVDEYEYDNGSHRTETISYMVIEAGTHELEDGTKLVAGHTTVGSSWGRVDLGSSLGGTPVILAQTTSTNEASAVTTRLRNVTSNGFEVKVQEEEAGGAHAAETVSWIAIETGTGTTEGTKFEAVRTGQTVRNGWVTRTFFQDFSTAPVVLANVQTYADSDTIALRYTRLSADSFDVRVQEERSVDWEGRHENEVLGYFALEAGAIRGVTLGGGAAANAPTVEATAPVETVSGSVVGKPKTTSSVRTFRRAAPITREEMTQASNNLFGDFSSDLFLRNEPSRAQATSSDSSVVAETREKEKPSSEMATAPTSESSVSESGNISSSTDERSEELFDIIEDELLA